MSRALDGLCATLLDLEPAAAASLAADVEELARRLPLTARGALTTGARSLDLLSLVATGHRLHRLDARQRERFVSFLDRHAGPGELVDALKVPVLLAHGARTVEPSAGRTGGRAPARPDAEMDVVPAAEWPSRAVADAVVVGSGAGGAAAARSLARAGLRVVVLEEGRRFGVEEFRQRPALERFTDLYRDGGATVALGRPPILLPMGRGVGGTTLVNSGTCYRTPERVLHRWRDQHGVALADPERLSPLLDEVEATLQVAPVPKRVMGNNGRLALAGAAKLGWSAHPIRRNAPGCGGCCQCAIGCPRNAKFGVHLSFLPEACAAGAVIVSEARVAVVLHGGGRATGVRALRRDGTSFEILAQRVFLAAGATETPPLLRRSGLGGHPALGHNLALHPAVTVAGWFEEPVNATKGVLQSVGIDELHHSDSILIEATSTPPGMGSVVLPGAGRRLAEQLERIDHLATLGAMVGDGPGGSVHGSKRPVVRYALRREDAAKLVKAVGAMGEVLLAAGATSVLTGVRGGGPVRTREELAEAVGRARATELHVAAFHPTGTARMGRPEQSHPVDERGRLRGVEGVWVVDASVVPSCPEVNPQLTIMALSLAITAGALAS